MPRRLPLTATQCMGLLSRSHRIIKIARVVTCRNCNTDSIYEVRIQMNANCVGPSLQNQQRCHGNYTITKFTVLSPLTIKNTSFAKRRYVVWYTTFRKNLLPSSCTLTMEAAGSPKTLVNIYHTARRHITQYIVRENT